MRRLALLALLVAVPTAAAQDRAMTREELTCRILAVTPDGTEVLVDRGRVDGLIVGWRGSAWSIHKADDRRLGTAEVVGVAARVARIRVKATERVRKGDLVAINARVPKLKDRSELWRIARLGVVLWKSDGKTPHFTYRQLFAGETPELVDKVLAAMVAEIHAIKTFVDIEKHLGTKRYAKGRFKGKTPREALDATTKDDIRRFLQFIVEFPGKYWGKSWRLDETYATWVINDTPGVWAELRDRIVNAPSRDARAALILSEEAKKYDVVEKLRKRAIALSGEGRTDEAMAHVRAAEQAAVLLNEPDELPHILFAKAYVLDDQGRVKRSLRTYQDARVLYQAAGNKGSEGAVLHNIGVAYNKLGDFGRSLAAYREADRVYATVKVSASSAGLTKRVLADALFKAGEYVEALEAYTQAVELLKDEEGLTTALEGQAKTLAKLGRNDEAAAAHTRLLKMHQDWGERANEADDWENIGSQNWDLGKYRAALSAYTRSLEIRKELGVPSSIATALTNMGRLQMNLGELDACEESYREALRIHREETKDRGNEAEALADLGRLAVMRVRYEDALGLFERALDIQRDLGNRNGEAYVQVQIAFLRQERYEYEQTIEAYNEAVRLRRESGAKSALADVLRWRGSIHQQLRNYDTARRDNEEALRLTRETKERSAEAEALLSLGWLAWNRHDYGKARGFTRSALEIAERIDSRRLQATCQRRLGEIWSSEFAVDRARAAYDRALALYEDPQEIARTRLKIGELLRQRGDDDEALTVFRRAWQEANAAESKAVAQDALASIGGTLQEGGQTKRALRAYEMANELEPDNDWTAAYIYRLMAWAHHDLGARAQALEWQTKAYDLFVSLRNDWGLSGTLRGFAEIYRANGDAKRAQEYIDRAFPFARRSGDRSELASVLGMAGKIALDLDDPDTALKHIDAAIAEARARNDTNANASLLMLMGRAKRLQGDYAAAEKALAESLALFKDRDRPSFQVEVLTEQAEVALARAQPAAALTALTQAQELAANVESPHIEWKVLYVRSRALEAQGELGKAAEAREQAIGVLDRMQSGLGDDERAQREFLRSKIEVYESMATLLGNLAEKEQDKAKQTKLVSDALLYAGRVSDEIASAGAQSERREALKRRLGKLDERIRDARAKGNTELAKTLAKNRDDLVDKDLALRDEDEEFATRTKFEPDTYADPDHEDNYARHLPDNARMVLYVTLKEKLHIWVYSNKGFVVWKTKDVGAATINTAMDEYRTLMSEVATTKPKGRGFGAAAEQDERNPDWYRTNAKRTRELLTEMYKHLWITELDGIEKLVIVPYGRLNYLPFEALIGPDGRFLGETRQFAYCVTTKHLEKTLKRLAKTYAAPQHHWVAYADPVGKLNEALEEAAEIQPLFERHQIHTQESGTATEDNLAKLPKDCTILHFATHGYLHKTKPADHYIELGARPGEEGDGKLMYKEIRNHLRRKLPCLKERNLRLVVLSACSTAVGSKAATADVFAMPWAFGWAGAPAVVATLWKVDKWATTGFMVEFYRLLAQEKKSPGEAMQGARLELIKKKLKDRARGRYSHPYYWSPFLLYGDWR